VVSLRYGVLLCRVEIDVDGGEEFSVITPAATISVKGTEFAVEHKERKSTIGVLNEGHVLVRVPGFRKEVLMRFNQETIVSKGSPPRDFRVLTQLYPHKVQMGEMRTRIKQLKRHETALTPQQRAMLRAGWKNTNALPPREKSAASAGKSSGTPSKQR
jgi:hypothetical protein